LVLLLASDLLSQGKGSFSLGTSLTPAASPIIKEPGKQASQSSQPVNPTRKNLLD
jgi:hypothetical protein